MKNVSLKVQHISLQFSDDRVHQRHDVRQLFAKGKDFPIKTGTESGPEEGNANLEFLREFSKEFNHVLHSAAGNWIAIDRKIIKSGSVKKGKVFVVKNDYLVGRQHDRIFPTLAFTHKDPRIGRVAQATAHYSTRGKTPGDPNYDTNRLYARKLGDWMQQASRRFAMSFVNGDFNMVDKLPGQDWAFGGKFTSMADELKAWENTGHGPIDGFCSYDKDVRVKAQRFNVLTDKEMFMHTDHFVCRGVWSIGLKKH